MSSDQVRLFSQAEIVVAPHGAGLTNILFAENLIVIELLVHMLFQAFFFRKCWFSLWMPCVRPQSEGIQ